MVGGAWPLPVPLPSWVPSATLLCLPSLDSSSPHPTPFLPGYSCTLPPAAGGEPGASGLNLLIRKDGRTVNLGGKTSVTVYPGVRELPAVSTPLFSLHSELYPPALCFETGSH